MKKFYRALLQGSVVVSGMVAAGAAMGADGEITFVGNVTTATCKINNGQPDFQVTLPTVSTQTLNTNGATAGRTPFTIALTECSEGLDTVSVYFEPGSYTNLTDNRLINIANVDSNVQIQLLNNNLSAIRLGEGVNNQNSQNATVVNGSANLTYFAEYYATGAAVAGTVQSATEYTVIYP